ncbi:hypothetical protein J4456_02700, partial [Candidatus Pacearchaeota archaeon]|nr:hypothetical protein [Candidatus Pacearchaeota archaeon]
NFMEEIIVGQGEYKKARAPDELDSGGIGPCIAIGAIYNKRGYMVHEHSVGHNYADFIDTTIFRDLRKDVKDKKNLQIYIIGAGIEINDEYKDNKIAGRQAVLDKIVENGFQEAVKDIRWCPTNYTQSLRLILSECRAEIEEDEDDLEEYEF